MHDHAHEKHMCIKNVKGKTKKKKKKQWAWQLELCGGF